MTGNAAWKWRELGSLINFFCSDYGDDCAIKKKKVIVISNTNVSIEAEVASFEESINLHKAKNYSLCNMRIGYFQLEAFIYDLLTEWTTVKAFSNIILLPSQAFLILMRHGFLRYDEISLLLLPNAESIRGSNPVCIALDEFYRPHKLNVMQQAVPVESNLFRIVGFLDRIDCENGLETQKELIKLNEQEIRLHSKVIIVEDDNPINIYRMNQHKAPQKIRINSSIVSDCSFNSEISDYLKERQQVMRILNCIEFKKIIIERLKVVETELGLAFAQSNLEDIARSTWFIEKEMMTKQFCEEEFVEMMDSAYLEKIKESTRKWKFTESFLHDSSKRVLIVVESKLCAEIITKHLTREGKSCSMSQNQQSSILLAHKENYLEYIHSVKGVTDVVLLIDNDAVSYNLMKMLISHSDNATIHLPTSEDSSDLCGRMQFIKFFEVIRSNPYDLDGQKNIAALSYLKTLMEPEGERLETTQGAILTLEGGIDMALRFCHHLPSMKNSKGKVVKYPEFTFKTLKLIDEKAEMLTTKKQILDGASKVEFVCEAQLPLLNELALEIKNFLLEPKNYSFVKVKKEDLIDLLDKLERLPRVFVGKVEVSKKRAQTSCAFQVLKTLYECGLCSENFLPCGVIMEIREQTEELEGFLDSAELKNEDLFEQSKIANIPSNFYRKLPSSLTYNDEWKKVGHLLENNQSQTFYMHEVRFASSDSFSPKHSFAICLPFEIKEELNFDIFFGMQPQQSIVSAGRLITFSASEMTEIVAFQAWFFRLILPQHIKTIKGDIEKEVSLSVLSDDKKYSYLVIPMKIKEGRTSRIEPSFDFFSKYFKSQSFYEGDLSTDELQVDWELMSGFANLKSFRDFIQEAQRNTDDIPLDDLLLFVKDTVVLYAEYHNILYTSPSVDFNLTPLSPIPDSLKSNNYMEYLQEKYGVQVTDLSQPMVSVKRFKTIGNMCKSPLVEKIKKKRKNAAPSQSQFYVPELLFILPVSRSFVELAFSLPTIIHSIEMHCLKKEFIENCSSVMMQAIPHFEMPSMLLIRDALTCISANYNFDYERLEFIGDSFLKYVASKQVFFENLEKPEGELTKLRQQIISNSNLHRIAVNIDVASYANFGEFMTRLFFPPYLTFLFTGAQGMQARKKIPFDVEKLFDPTRLWKEILDIYEKIVQDNQVIKVSTDGRVYANHKNAKEILCENGKIPSASVEFDKSLIEDSLSWRNIFVTYCAKTLADLVESLIGSFVHEKRYDDCEKFMFFFLNLTKFQGPLGWQVPDIMDDDDLDAGELDKLSALQSLLNYKFNHKALLKAAINANGSWSHGNLKVHKWATFERLEFLGDSAIDFLISRYFYEKNESWTPGEITEIRQTTLSNDGLGRLCVKLGLHKFIEASPAETSALNEFAKWINDNPTVSWVEYKVACPKVLADSFEALGGALLIDLDFDLEKLWIVIKPWLEWYLTLIGTFEEGENKHPWKNFLEVAAALKISNKQIKIVFQDILTSKGGFKCELYVNGSFLCSSLGSTKGIAKKEACKMGVEILESRGVNIAIM